MITITQKNKIYKIMILNICNKGMIYDKIGNIAFTYDYEHKNMSFEGAGDSYIELNGLYLNSIDFIGANPILLKINNCRIFNLKEKIEKENYCKLIEIQTAENNSIEIESFGSDPAFIFGKKIIYYRIPLKYNIAYTDGYWVYMKN